MQRPLRKDDSELNDIAEKCLESTKQLQAILKSLISSSSRRRNQVKSGVKAVQLSFSEEITGIEHTIHGLRENFDTRILVSLR